MILLVFIAASSLKRRVYAGLGDVGVLVFATYFLNSSNSRKIVLRATS